jgi:nicotinamide mononucleotide transporter
MLEKILSELLWTDQRWIELIASVASIAYVVLAAKRSIWCWPLGVLGAILFVYVFYVAKFYALTLEYGVYVFLCSYGWYAWGRGDQAGHELPVRSMRKQETVWLVLIGLVTYVVVGFLLWKFTDASLPFRDSFTTSFSFVAQWMTTKKILQNWLLWIVVDLIYLTMFAFAGTWYAFGYYVILTIIAVFGYLAWRKAMLSQTDLKTTESAENTETAQ